MYVLDTANIEQIREAIKLYQLDGVTTNPTILSREKQADYFGHLKALKDLLKDKRLYVQVTASNFEAMKEEVEVLKKELGTDISIKIPASSDGFQLMKHLKGNMHVTATAICSFELGLMSIACGANALALYMNRMANEGIDANQVTSDLRTYIDQNHLDVRLIGASYKNVVQIRQSFLSGVHQATISYDLLKTSMQAKILRDSIKQFEEDFRNQYQVENALHIKK